jgi:hypothetical protein
MKLNLREVHNKLKSLGYVYCQDGVSQRKSRWVKNLNQVRKNLMIYVVEYDFTGMEHVLPPQDPGTHFDVRIYMGDTNPAVELTLYSFGWDIENLWKTLAQADDLVPKLLELFPEEVHSEAESC